MSYMDFESKMMKQNRYLIWTVVASILIFGIGFSGLAFQKSYFIQQGGDLFQERMLAENVCKESFVSVVSKAPNPHLVSKGIFNVLKEKSFEIEMKEILKVDSLEKGACRVILESGEGLLAFKVTLLESSSFPFYYKLNQIDELALDKEWL
jgi:hypothetical protein